MNEMKVITVNAYTLGEVDGIHADTDTWKITHLDVGLTKEATRELGFKKSMLGSLSVCLPITVVKNRTISRNKAQACKSLIINQLSNQVSFEQIIGAEIVL